MTSLTITFTIIMVVIAVLIVIVVIYDTSDKNKKAVGKKIIAHKNIDYYLDILKKNSVSGSNKAAAFYALVCLGYIFTLITVNSGDKYNDKKQCERFCNYATEDRINKISKMETVK